MKPQPANLLGVDMGGVSLPPSSTQNPRFDGWMGGPPDVVFLSQPKWVGTLWRRQVYRSLDYVRAHQKPTIPD